MILLFDMHKIKYIFIALGLSLLIAHGYFLYTIHRDVSVHGQAISEMVAVMTRSGLVVPDKEGKATINTLLLDAWKQANNTP